MEDHRICEELEAQIAPPVGVPPDHVLLRAMCYCGRTLYEYPLHPDLLMAQIRRRNQLFHNTSIYNRPRLIREKYTELYRPFIGLSEKLRAQRWGPFVRDRPTGRDAINRPTVKYVMNRPTVRDAINRPPVRDARNRPPVRDARNRPPVRDARNRPTVRDAINRPTVEDAIEGPTVVDAIDRPTEVDAIDRPTEVDAIDRPTAVDAIERPEE
ncbi:uncharacterized protein LOC117219593 [Megalopta genalis]|uniref:uncharacterized protein LOC117219593 n=1 Tax=Megalopta genalis TaxID=115081 RepID=UPI003FD5F03F